MHARSGYIPLLPSYKASTGTWLGEKTGTNGSSSRSWSLRRPHIRHCGRLCKLLKVVVSAISKDQVFASSWQLLSQAWKTIVSTIVSVNMHTSILMLNGHRTWRYQANEHISLHRQSQKRCLDYTTCRLWALQCSTGRGTWSTRSFPRVTPMVNTF